MRKLFWVVFLGAVAAAQEKPLTPEQAAGNVVAALEAEDAAALTALAKQDTPDPWLVADTLCAQGKHDAAEAFAKAAPRPDTEKLPAYVAAQRAQPTDPKAREALAAAIRAFDARNYSAVLAAVQVVKPATASTTSVRLLHGQGFALRRLRRLRASSAALAKAGAAARSLGWLRHAGVMYDQAGLSAYQGSDWETAIRTWRASLAIELRRRDRGNIARMLGNIGNVHRSLGQYPKALELQQRVLKMMEALGNRAGVAGTLGNIGLVHYSLGQYPKALEIQQRALKMKQEIGNRAGVALTLGNIGNIHSALGQYAKALELHERELEMRQALGDRAGVAAALANSAGIYRSLGQYAKALELYGRALEMMQALGNRARVAATLGAIANVHYSLGEYPKALELHERALDMQQEMGRRAGVAATLGNIGVVYYSLGQYAKALGLYERALRVVREIGDRAGVAASLTNIASVHQSLGQYVKALAVYERALTMTREMGDRAGAATILGNIASILRFRGQYAEALAVYERALKMTRETGNRAGAATILGNIGIIHRLRGQYAKALELYERALEMKRKIGDRAGVALILGNIGGVHLFRGEYTKAHELFARALEMKQEIGDRAGAATTLGDIASVHSALGQYAKALELYGRALKMKREIGDRAGVAETLGNIGVVHGSLGQYARALELYERALKMTEEIGDRAGIARILSNIGGIHSSLGQYAKALELYERAHEMRQKIGDRAGVAQTLVNIGIIHRSLGQYAEALEVQQRALKMMQEIGDRAGIALTLGNIGSNHHSLGQYTKALELQQRALEMQREIGDRANATTTLGNIGVIYRSLGQHAKALDHYERALALRRELGMAGTHYWTTALGRLLLESLDRPVDAVHRFEESIADIEAQRDRARGFSEETRAGFFRKLRVGNPYLGLARAHLRLGHPGAALEALERGRARGVLDLLASSRFDPLAEAERRAREQGDRARLAQIAKVRTDLGAAEQDVRGYTHALSQEQVEPVRAALEAKLKQARTVRGEVLGRRARLIRDLVPVAKPASLATLQGALGRKERMLFYAVDEEGSLLFVVPPAGEKVVAHELIWPGGKPVRRVELERSVESYLAAMLRAGKAARGVTAPAKETSGDPGAGTRLSAALLPKVVRDELNGLDRVYLIPDGVLHRLPLEALPGKGLPPMVYGHSGSVLLWCKRKGRRGGARRYEVVALGDPVFSRRKVDDALPPETGVLVVAGHGALEAGDVVLAYDGRAVGDAKALKAEVRRVEDDVEQNGRRQVKLGVWRAGKEIEVMVDPGPLGIEVAREPPRKAWPKLREQSLLTLQRGASVDRFGDLARLPGTRREVEAIRKALGDKVAVLLGEQATKGALFRLAPRGRYLHLATHQLVDETERRGYSRMALTRPRLATPGDDGFLSLFELLGTWRDRLSGCELVVLSACETLKGPMQKDEGPYAMPLGFLYAGAPAVIGSLWRVDDASTAELFADFYKRLAKGTGKLEAFTEARKALRKKYPQPYFWAPFVYIGDPR